MPPTSIAGVERHALLAQAFLGLRDQRQRLIDFRRPTPASGSGSGPCRNAMRAGSRAAASGTAAARRGRSAPRAGRARDSARRAPGRRDPPCCLSAPRSNVRIVTGLPRHAGATCRYASNCSSSRGQPLAIEEQELGAEKPDAVGAVLQRLRRDRRAARCWRTARSRVPSSVVARVVLSRLSFLRARARTRPASAGTRRAPTRSGLTMTTFLVPSTISSSFSRISAARVVRRDDRGHVEAARDDRGVRA